MYLKLSVTEECISISGCWTGIIIALKEKPKIINKLPQDVVAGKCVNPTENSSSDCKIKEKTVYQNKHPSYLCDFDYYYDCKDVNRKTIEKALAILAYRCNTQGLNAPVSPDPDAPKLTMDEAIANLKDSDYALPFFPDEYYPEKIGIVSQLDEVLAELRKDMHLVSKNGLFKQNKIVVPEGPSSDNRQSLRQ